ncbi:hypothetical protein [Streptomyces sp. NPDC017988]|uniref:hypothetical protein n=1 Tax=Streptomyces sp. NPDC017988 TaxID=3365025 RepID=UPI0037A90680
MTAREQRDDPVRLTQLLGAQHDAVVAEQTHGPILAYARGSQALGEQQGLFEATTNAQQTQSLAPLRAFIHSWAVFVAIERHPQRAARLRELERLVNAAERDPTDAIIEIRRIRDEAEAEAGL